MKRPLAILRALDFHAVRFRRRLGGVGFGLLTGLSLLALALGVRGFHQLPPGPGRPLSPATDDVYQALQLFVLEFPVVPGEIPLALEMARFLAAFVTFSAVIGLLGRVFDNQVQVTRKWLLGHRHVVVCGLGERGGELVERLRRDRHFVVVIEPDPGQRDLERCRSWGADVQVGSPTDAWQLRKARVARAAVVLALSPEHERRNVEASVQAGLTVRPSRPTPLACILEVADPDLRTLVRKHRVADASGEWFDLQFFDRREACVRAMLREAFVQAGGSRIGTMLVVGWDDGERLGEALILRAAKDRYIEDPACESKLVVIAAASDAPARAADLRRRHPYLDQVCTIHARAATPDLVEADRLDVETPPEVAFVCLRDEAEAMIAADRLRDRLPPRVPIIVRTREREAGLGILIRERAAEGLIAVGLEDRALQLAATLQPVAELLAQSVHQEYLAHQDRTATPGSSHPPKASARLWEELTEGYRDASRAQARDFRRKLGLVGCRAVYAPDGLIDLHRFSPAEVERLARDEHDRWCSERRAMGWRLGPVRDDDNRLHPNLVPWEDDRLDEVTRGFDRNAIARLPTVLALADYRIEKIDPMSESRHKAPVGASHGSTPTGV